MKKFLLIFFSFLFFTTATVGGGLLLSGCNSSYSQEESGEQDSNNENGTDIDEEDNESENGETGEGETGGGQNSEGEEVDDDVTAQSTNFNFTIKVVWRNSSSNAYVSSDSNYPNSADDDYAGCAGGFDFYWYDEKGSYANLTANEHTYSAMYGETVTQDGGDKGTSRTYNLKYMYYKFSAVSTYKRYGVIHPSVNTEFFNSSNMAFCGVSTNYPNSVCRTETSSTYRIYGSSKITTSSSTAKNNCSGTLTGTYYLIFRNKGDIIYDANGGTGAPASQQGLSGVGYTIPSTTPKRTGYRFCGWSSSPNDSPNAYNLSYPGRVIPDSSASGGFTWYAVWEPLKYINTYYYMDTSSNKTLYNQSRTFGKAFTTLSTSSISEYVSNGWSLYGWLYNSETGIDRTYAPNTSVTSTTYTQSTSTLNWYAISSRTITIKYDANGGSGAPSNSTGTQYWNQYGNKVSTVSIKLSSTDPTRTGYTFLGWSTSSSATSATYTSGAKYSFSNAYNSSASVTLYAVWEVNSYYLDINSNIDGIAANNGRDGYTYDVYVDNSLVADNVIDFYRQINYSSTVKVDIVGTATGYGYTKMEYPAGQSSTSTSISFTMPAEKSYVTIYYEIYKFRIDVNIVSPNGVQDYNSGTMNLYYSYNNSTHTNLTDQPSDSSSVPYNSTITISNIKPATGMQLSNITASAGKIVNNNDGTYTFTANMATKPSGSWDSIIKINMKYQVYTITLNKQGGSGGTNTIYLKYNTGWYSNSAATSSIVKISVPTRVGFTFQGYYTGTNGTGTQIINSNGEINSGRTTITTSNISLHANWSAKNPARYDSEKGYWYVEMGMYPQTRATQTEINGITNTNGAVYTINGSDVTSKVGANSIEYCQYNGVWYKVEPVRYVLAGDYSAGNGYENANVLSISEKIVYVSEWSVENNGLDSKYIYTWNTSSDMFKNNSTLHNNLINNFWSESGLSVYKDSYNYIGTRTDFYVENFPEIDGTSTSETIPWGVTYLATSTKDLDTVFGSGNYEAEFSDLVSDILKNKGNNLMYWTRDVGSNLNNAECITRLGTVTQAIMQNLLGVRITVNVKTFGCL